MDHQREKRRLRIRRAYRVGKKIKGTAEQPRLSIRRSLQHIYCQVIDDNTGRTLVSANTREKELRGQLKYGGNCAAAVAVGRLVAQRAKAAGIQAMCVDRGSCKYHGRVAALTQAVREEGIHV